MFICVVCRSFQNKAFPQSSVYASIDCKADNHFRHKNSMHFKTCLWSSQLSRVATHHLSILVMPNSLNIYDLSRSTPSWCFSCMKHRAVSLAVTLNDVRLFQTLTLNIVNTKRSLWIILKLRLALMSHPDCLMLIIQFGILVKFSKWQIKCVFFTELDWADQRWSDLSLWNLKKKKNEVLSPCIIPPSYLSSTHQPQLWHIKADFFHRHRYYKFDKCNNNFCVCRSVLSFVDTA